MFIFDNSAEGASPISEKSNDCDNFNINKRSILSVYTEEDHDSYTQPNYYPTKTNNIGIDDFDDIEVDDEDYDEGKNVESLDYDYEHSYEDVTDFQELPHCETDTVNEERRAVVVVSTLDGHLTGLDAVSGDVIWSHQTGGNDNSMLSSSMSKLEVTSRGEWVRLIPSLDGGIYRFDGESVEALPVTVDTLLHSSFKFNDDTIFSGAKNSEILGLDAETGRLVYMCNDRGCRRQRAATAHSSHVLVIRRTTQTLRAIDPKTGNERWNFSVGQHELNIAGGGCDSSVADEVIHLPSLNFIIPDGIVWGVDEESHLQWQHQLGSPIVGAWRIKRGKLEKIDLFSSVNVPALSPEVDNETPSDMLHKEPSVYVGIHKKQLYIQHNGNMHKEIHSIANMFAAPGINNQNVAFPRVKWQPYLATATSRTPVLHHSPGRRHPILLDYERKHHSTQLTIRHNLDYPYDNGYYLYGNDGGAQINDSDIWDEVDLEDDVPNSYSSFGGDVADQLYQFCFVVGPEFWWKLSMGIAAYIFLHLVLFRYLLRRARRHFAQQARDLVHMVVLELLRTNPRLLTMIHRLGLEVAPLPAPPIPQQQQHQQQFKELKDGMDVVIPPLPLDDIHLPISLDSPIQSSPSVVTSCFPYNNSSSEGTQRQDSNSSQFSSRYLSDFEPVLCLGRGGFGVVFQVRNKLDENEYAVKRILLPSKESSAERVKREVRALAKLNHNNIVRYYNSWLETPPVGWLEEADTWWKNSDVVSTSLLSPDADDTEDGTSTRNCGSKKTGAKEESLSAILDKIGPKCNQINLGEENSSHRSSSGYEDDVDDDSDDSDDSHRNMTSNHHCSEDDDSFKIVFENCDVSNNKNVIIEDNSDSFDIVFEDSGGQNDDRSSLDVSQNNNDSSDNKLLLRRNNNNNNNYHTNNSDSVSESIVFENSSLCGGDYTRSSNTGNSSNDDVISTSQFNNIKEKAIKRRRIQSQCFRPQSPPNRPVSLNLVHSHSDPTTNMSPSIIDNNKLGIASRIPRTYLYIQMELCQKESLKDWLFKNQTRSSATINAIFNDIVRAVEYVHDNYMMHRDLKPSNIFFSLDNEVKVGDFGLVTTIAEDDEDDVLTPAGLVKSQLFGQNIFQRTRKAGTQLYMSPEQISGKVYDYKVDIFSLGLVFFEMLVPFNTEMERRHVMSDARDRKFPPEFAEKYKDEHELLNLMLCQNPNERPTTRGIRTKNPLRSLQGESITNIKPEDHFKLNRVRTHSRSHSGGGNFTFLLPTST